MSGAAEINWEKLKAEFLSQDLYITARTWLREEKGWDDEKCYNGNTNAHTWGWSTEWAKVQQEKGAQKLEAAKAAEAELLPLIVEAKSQIIMDYIDILRNGELVREKREGKWVQYRRPLNTRDKSHILNKLKTELGEPAVITRTKTEDLRPYNPIDALLHKFGVIDENGELMQDAKPAEPTTPEG